MPPVYASKTLEKALTDKSIEQLVNAATLPGIVGYASPCPTHQTAASRRRRRGAPARRRDPPGSGHDVNCGVRLLASDEVEPPRRPRRRALPQLPQRMGKAVATASTTARWTAFWRKAHWCLNGLATQRRDPQGKEAACQSRRAKSARPRPQRTRSARAAQPLPRGRPLAETTTNVPTPLTHPGQWSCSFTAARRLGHQVCTDYVRDFNRHWRARINFPTANWSARSTRPRRGLIGAMQAADPSPAGIGAPGAMKPSSRSSPRRTSSSPRVDVSHNIGKLSSVVDGKHAGLRSSQGARAFPPGHDGPAGYRRGQPVLVLARWGPPVMLASIPGAMEQTFGSACHGAGATSAAPRPEAVTRRDAAAGLT